MESEAAAAPPSRERFMQVKRPVTGTITIGDQPTEDDLSQLKQEGYTGVVNLRNEGEPDQPMNTTDEGNKVRALGMDYVHYGVGSTPLTVQSVSAVCDFIDKHSEGSEKVLVHCRRGPRAIALVLLQQAAGTQMDQRRGLLQG